MTPHVTSQALAVIIARLQPLSGSHGIPKIARRPISQIRDPDLPAIIVQYDGEGVGETTASRSSRPIQNREIRFSVIAADKLPGGIGRDIEGEVLEDRLLDLGAAVEEVLLDPDVEGALIHNITLRDVDMEISDEGERPLGYLRQQFSMTVRTRSGAPKTPL